MFTQRICQRESGSVSTFSFSILESWFLTVKQGFLESLEKENCVRTELE